MMEALNPQIIGLKHRTYKNRLPYVNYNLATINRNQAKREIFVRLQLSTTRMQQSTKFPLELGTFTGKLTTKQVYEELIAALQAEIAKMPCDADHA
jgi:hypothetical protein